MNITKINDNIYRTTAPYKGIYTTLYAVKTPNGALLFDAASFDEDVDNYMVPFLNELGITADSLKYVFISHNHMDHAGALSPFMKRYPNAAIISRSPALKEKFAEYNVIMPEDGDSILDVLRVVTIPGHTMDSSAVYDTRTKNLICGDCLQLYGIFGAGEWGANIRFPAEHMRAIEKLRKMDIEHILTAHDYHPYGYSYVGKEAIEKALDACIAPLDEIKGMINANPELDDEAISKLYNNESKPTLGKHVVTALRAMIE